MNAATLLDVHDVKARLLTMPLAWEGKSSIHEMYVERFPWARRHWFMSYFGYLCKRLLHPRFSFDAQPRAQYHFGMVGHINWDLCTKATKSDDVWVVLNDTGAIEESVEKSGCYGSVLALCDVEYGDVDRSLRKWMEAVAAPEPIANVTPDVHSSISRYLITNVNVVQVLFLEITPTNIENLDEIRVGHHADTNTYSAKYLLDVERIEPFVVDRIVFPLDPQ